MLNIRHFITCICLILPIAISGQTLFKDSLVRSNPIPRNTEVPMEQKIATHLLFLETAQKNKVVLTQLFAYIYLFSDYYLSSNYTKATEMLLRAESVASEANNPAWIAEIVSRKAILSLQLEQPEKTIEEFTKAVILFRVAGDSLRVAECTEQLAATHIQLHNYPEAQRLYQIAMPLLETYGSERELRVALSNYATIFLFLNQPEKAIPYLKRSLAINVKLNDYFKQAQDLGDLGNAYSGVQNYAQALNCYQQSVSLATKNNYASVLYNTWLDMSESFEKQGKLDPAHTYFKKYHHLRDSIVGKETQENILALQQQFELKSKDLEIQKNEAVLSKTQQDLHNRNILLISTILLMLSVGFIAIRIHRDRKQKVKMHEAQQKVFQMEMLLNAQLQNALSSKVQTQNKDLVEMALDITRKNDFVDELMDKIEKITTTKQTINTEQIQELRQFILVHQKLDLEKEIFHENIESINHEFYEKLTLKFGDLTKTEKEICSLLRLNLSTKEIATIKSISPNSAKMARYRLRKRLHLDENTDIVLFLQNL